MKKTVNGVVTYYLHDGDQVIEERGSGGVLQATYTYGSGIDEALTMNRGGQTYYYFHDGLGSVTDLTKSTGELVESYSYDAYGQPSAPSTVGNPYMFTGREYDQEAGLYYYRARFYHPGIGRFLQRDPWTWGPNDPRVFAAHSLNNQLSWLTAPVAELQRLPMSVGELVIQSVRATGSGSPALRHLYLYVGNNPLNWVDPLGLDKQRPWWDWWAYESVVPGPYGQPLSEWQPGAPTWGDPLKYTEAAGGGWKWTERGAIGVAVVSTGVATGAILTGSDPWIGTIGLHPAHHGLGRHLELILRLGGRTIKLILPGKDRFIWWGLK